jgi:hypothetical protein
MVGGFNGGARFVVGFAWAIAGSNDNSKNTEMKYASAAAAGIQKCWKRNSFLLSDAKYYV